MPVNFSIRIHAHAIFFPAETLIVLAMLMRVAAGISASAQVPFLWGSALSWSTAFLITAVWFPLRRNPGSTKP